MDYLPISSLNHYNYCPKSVWIMFVCGEFLSNADTVEGALLHERADSSERTVRGELIQHRTIFLYSDHYQIIGLADLIEEVRGKVYPVEYKKGQQGEWLNHQIQLCAQALCLEEMLHLRRRIREGYVYYAANGRRKAIRLTRRLRATTTQTITATRALLESSQAPVVKYGPKCRRCSLYPICLPKEVELLNSRRRKGGTWLWQRST